MITHYVTFLYPGSFMPEESNLKINSREDKFEIPNTCFAYYFWDREEVEQDGELLCGKEKNRSGRYYFGRVMTIEDVRKEVPDSKTLVSNMEMNGWPTVVKTRRGNFQPIREDDTVISEQSK